eukprot:1160845-Pelagomonas_calceolata.AAC.5
MHRCKRSKPANPGKRRDVETTAFVCWSGIESALFYSAILPKITMNEHEALPTTVSGEQTALTPRSACMQRTRRAHGTRCAQSREGLSSRCGSPVCKNGGCDFQEVQPTGITQTHRERPC